MGVTWTKEQQQVIDLRDRNILVSAAAGSGKTAVLVERIISMVTNKESPIDIDKLLIVTFTNAAAGQMRERISEAIEKRLEEEPQNEHLQKQSSLVHNAFITTIHSFCLRVIRNNFNQIDLDPSFRIGDEGELKLLKSDVLERMLERHYEEKSEDFFHFVESYSTGKSDKELEALILQLYQFAMSYPWPKEWLEDCVKGYELNNLEDLEQTRWYQDMIQNIQTLISDMVLQLEELIEVAISGDGPYMYEENLRLEKEQLQRVLKATSYVEYYQYIAGISFGRLSSKKDEAVSGELRELVKKQRDGIKKSISSILEKYFFDSPDHILEDIKNCKRSIQVLVDLTKEFMEDYATTKLEKNLIDYNDLEHFALNILVEKKGEGWESSVTAKEFQEIFEEIMIDEYQDSNLVQEMLLRSVSKENSGTFNSFMVGDVKQSIYKFRLARPELFMEKYDTYSLSDSKKQRIDLDRNFRSRREVLDGTNFIFQQIMGKSLGGIDYNKECALYPGSEFLEPVIERDFAAELLVVDLDSDIQEDEKNGKDEKEYNARELEAKAIAARIKELIHEEKCLKIIDKKTNEYRTAKFSDIVILLRTISGWAETFTSILMAEGIPAHTGSQTGYFSTIEVTTLLNYLRIIDNPLQDIPFTGVLKSPIGGLTGEELAIIKSNDKELSMYEGCKQYAIGGQEEKLRNKLQVLFEQIEQFRKKAVHTPIHELIWIILDQTNYGRLIAAMPSGEKRRANLEMLVEKAIAFESTSYKGLFNFIRYIENLQKYDVDFGEAEVVNETDDTVRIMSIHKSKGLEFPIVFVSGMGKSFNNQDARAKLIMHPDLGIGADYIDFENRVKAPTLMKRALQRQIQMENLGEELRVLYVALTRAKEKLILTGAIAKLESKVNNWYQSQNFNEKLSFREVSESSNYMDWVLQALLRHKDSGKFLEGFELVGRRFELPFQADSQFEMKVIQLASLVHREILEQITEETTREELLQGLTNQSEEEEIRTGLEERLHFVYPYEVDKNIHTKMTVSEIKKLGQMIDDTETSFEMMKEEIPIPLLPKFVSENQEMEGADRGTAYHKVLQLLDFQNAKSKEVIQSQIEDMQKEKKLSKEAASCIDVTKIYKLLQSDIGQRLCHAALQGNLHKERPFVMGLEARKINPNSESEELVLVQGIIDVYFEEENEIILVDYKTDYVRSGEELFLKYKIQLDYYEEALSRVTGKKVKEKIIYSLFLEKEFKII